MPNRGNTIKYKGNVHWTPLPMTATPPPAKSRPKRKKTTKSTSHQQTTQRRLPPRTAIKDPSGWPLAEATAAQAHTVAHSPPNASRSCGHRRKRAVGCDRPIEMYLIVFTDRKKSLHCREFYKFLPDQWSEQFGKLQTTPRPCVVADGKIVWILGVLDLGIFTAHIKGEGD